MAIVNFHRAVNMDEAGAWEGTITNATASNITIDNFAGRSASYNGSFVYSSDDLVGGTLLSFSEYEAYSLFYSVSGLSLSAVTFKNYMLSGDAIGLVEFLAGGADTFNGSSGDDLMASLGGNDELFGNAGADFVYGGAGDDELYGGSGNDYLAGESGTDWAVFQGARASYTVQNALSGYTVIDSTPSRDGTDTVNTVERLVFSDRSVNLTVGATAKSVTAAQVDSLIELYIAYINRVPDADGMEFWIGQLKAGQTLSQIGESFYSAAVQFSSLTGYSASMSNADFVTLVYSNVLGRDEVDEGGMNFWSNQLATGQASRGTLVASILNSAHSFKGDATYGWVADLLDNKIEVGLIFSIEQGLVYNTSEASISNGMQIAAAITPTSIAEAIALIGVNDGFSLY